MVGKTEGSKWKGKLGKQMQTKEANGRENRLLLR